MAWTPNTLPTEGDDSFTGSDLADPLLNLLGGNDSATAQGGNDTVNGGDGNDTIDGGAGNDTLNGDAGDDTISDTIDDGGTTSISGGADDDVINLYILNAGAGTVDGGSGSDQLSVGGSQNLGSMTFAGMEFLNTNGGVVTGTAAQFEAFDTIRYNADYPNDSVYLTLSKAGTVDLSSELGTRGVNITGSDVVVNVDPNQANSGNDKITSGDGDDVFSGRGGNDTLSGGIGNDTIDGGAGDDAVTGGSGNDSLEGGTGNDTLQGNAGDDIISDTIDDGGTTSISAGTDDDSISLYVLNAGAGTVDGGTGNDQLTIQGSQILGSLTFTGMEILNTIGGNVRGTATQFEAFDTIRYNADFPNDRVYLTLSKAGIVDLSSELGTTAASITGSEVVLNVDPNQANSGNDGITTGGGDDAISGLGGNDTISGGAGNDTIDGGAGNDTLNGDAGDDTISDTIDDGGTTSISGGADNDVVNLYILNAGAGTVDGGSGSDQLSVGGSQNLGSMTFAGMEFLNTNGGVVTGTAAQFEAFDTIRYNADYPNDSVYLTLSKAGTVDLSSELGTRGVNITGSDVVVNVDPNQANSGNDKITSGDGDDVFSGRGGNDTLSGGIGNDTIDGGAGDDAVTGGSGNDSLEGGTGNDTLQGNAGDDIISDTIDDGGTTSISAGTDDDSISLYVLNAGAGTVDGGTGNDQLTIQGSQILGSLTFTGMEILNTIGGNVRGTATQFEAFDTIRYNADFPNDRVYLTLSKAGIVDLSSELGTTAASITGSEVVLNVDPNQANSGNDGITTGGGDDAISGLGGNDAISGGAGNDTIDGGSDTDTVAYSGLRSDYTVTEPGNGYLHIADKRGGSPDGIDDIVNVEKVSFGNGVTFSAASLRGAAEYAISDALTVAEGGALQFTITRSNATGNGAVTVSFGGTATSGEDYTAPSTLVQFTNGQYTRTVTVPTLTDTKIEPNETVTVSLSNPTAGGAIAEGQGTAGGIITDQTAPPVYTVGTPAAAIEGNDLVFTITRTATGTAETVSYSLAGSAGSPSDYNAPSGSVEFGLNDVTKTVTIATKSDTVIEGSETVELTLGTLSGTGTIGQVGKSATGTITDATPQPAYTVTGPSPGSVSEGGDLTFTVNRTTTGVGETVNFSLGGTATEGTDYTSPGTSVVFGAGDTSKTVTIHTLTDAAAESTESVELTLGSRSGGGTLGVPASASVSILDATGTPVYTIADASPVTEGGALSFTISRTASGAASTVTYSLGGTASQGADYTAPSGSVDFGINDLTKVVTIATKTDAVAEPDETVSLTLTNAPGGTLGAVQTGVGTILDSNGAPVYTIADASPVTEGGTLSFTISRTASGAASTVTYSLGGTASQGADYTAPSGSVDFGINDLTKVVTIATKTDAVTETDETVSLTLTAASDGTLGGVKTGTGAITDTTGAPVYTISNADAAAEGGSLSFTISRTTSGTDETISYSLGGTALPTADYTPPDGTVTFKPDELVKVVTVATKTDTVIEADETVSLTLTHASGSGTFGAAKTGTGTITDATPDPVYSIGNAAAVTEGGDLVFTVTRTSTGTQETVNYTLGGTATQNDDYTPPAGSVTFGADEVSKTIVVGTKTNAVPESPETVSLTLTNASGTGTVDATPGVGTILDATATPVYSIAAAPTVGEGGTLMFTVSRTTAGASETVSYSLGGSASPGLDYTVPSGSVTFGASDLTATVSVVTKTDKVIESDETVSLTLTNASGTGMIGASDSASGTITDATPASVYTIGNASPVAEGGNLQFTVSRTATGTVETVSFSLGGSATPNDDYTVPSTSVTFAANELTKTIEVATKADALVEGNEAVTLLLTGTSGAGKIGGADTGSGTIIDSTGAGVTITGTAGADLITPSSTVPGQPFPTAFGDTIFGLAGNDTLNGGLGADRMEGSYGDDTYYVDSPGDTVIEQSGRGTDTVITGLASYSLASTPYVENLVYSGAVDFTGTGNNRDNTIIGGAGKDVLSGGNNQDFLDGKGGNDVLRGDAGNDVLKGGDGHDSLFGGTGNDNLDGGNGNDLLDGGKGADTMSGSYGDDTYYVDNPLDVVVELSGRGTDTIVTTLSSYSLASTPWVENLTFAGSGNFTATGNNRTNTITGGSGDDKITGGNAADTLLGGAGKDSIDGGLGNDVINGGPGNDVLTGGKGNDSFVFKSALSSGNIDTLTDFAHGADRLVLDHTVFTQLSAGSLDASAFIQGTAATTPAQHIVYDATTGTLSYDANGSDAGGLSAFAKLKPGAILDHTDIFVV
jgi:Ca2+-binding RTX toxin-like protein